MARVVFGTYMVRYPVGGSLSSALQWIVGLHRLGHDVFVVEKSGWRNSCFDPLRREHSDHHAYGFRVVSELLERYGLGGRLSYVDVDGVYHGLGAVAVRDAIKSADVFIDRGAHGAWFEMAADAEAQILIDGEPARRQMEMARDAAAGREPLPYDHYFTVGLNVGTPASAIPTFGRFWQGIMPPIVIDDVGVRPCPPDARVTTVMNWRAHDEFEYGGQVYGQKDTEFERFFSLPSRVTIPLEVAVAGDAPLDRLTKAGWHVRDAIDVTVSFDEYWTYITNSLAEFSPAKNVFVATNSGWFSERSAAYLAAGRPVVVQDTGFSDHLPCGEGLFAVTNLDEASVAIKEIAADYERHSRRAREIAVEYFDARKVVGGLLREIGVA